MQVSEEVRRFLADQAFAVVAMNLDLGSGEEVVVLVKTRRDMAEALRAARAPVETGWVVETTAHGPVVCWLVRCEASGAGDLVGEVYLDPADPSDLGLLESLARQERVRVGFLDEDLEPAWVAELAWDEVRRLEAEQVRDRAEELLERAEVYDFEGAKDAFQERYSLDALVERVFPAASTLSITRDSSASR